MVTCFVIHPIARQMRYDRTPTKFGKSRQWAFGNYYEIGMDHTSPLEMTEELKESV